VQAKTNANTSFYSFPNEARYCSSLTFSIHSTILPSKATWGPLAQQ